MLTPSSSSHPQQRALGRTLSVLAAVFVLATGGCNVSPKPLPPTDTGFDFGKVRTHETGALGPKAIEGGPGSAGPPGALVRAFNLEIPEDPVDAVIALDGSFEIELFIIEGDEVRLQIIDGDERLLPVDVVVGPDDTAPALAVRALGHCLTLQPNAELDVAQAQTVQVQNGCSEQVTIIEPTVRRTTPGLAVGSGGSWPAQIAAGSSISVSVQFQAPAGSLEEIVFIEATAPAADRRPITVLPTP